jgi:hypothetical protein
MHRRLLLGLFLAAAPAAAVAQPATRRGARHEEVLGRNFDALPPGAKDRVTPAFRAGTPDLDEAAIRQRWDSMTPGQRGEVLTIHERRGPHAGRQGPAPRRGPPSG